jgi:predicted transcriptional regulator
LEIEGVSLNFGQPLVGRQLRVLREQLGLTRAELSEITGVNASAIYRLEDGDDVRLSNYFPIVEYFVARGVLVALDVARRDEDESNG